MHCDRREGEGEAVRAYIVIGGRGRGRLSGLTLWGNREGRRKGEPGNNEHSVEANRYC